VSSFQDFAMSDPAGSSFKSSLVTFVAAGTSVLLSTPAFVAEVVSWVPKSILGAIPSGSSFWTFVGLSEITAAIGDLLYLPLALVLNVFLVFRRQPGWLKVFVWAFFVVAVLGAIRVGSEVSHIRR
jgi:hypothetical protein